MNAPDAGLPSRNELPVPASKPRYGNLLVIVLLHGPLTAGTLRLAVDLIRGPDLVGAGRWYLPLWLPVIVLAMKWLVDRLSHWSNAAGLPVATSIGALGCSMLLAMSTWTMTPVLLGLMPVSAGIVWSLSPPPTPNDSILAVGLILTGSTALRLLPLHAYRAVQNATRPLATASAIGLAVLVLSAGVRGWQHPGIDVFLEQLRSGGEEVAPPGVPRNLPMGGISGVGVRWIPGFGAGAPGERRRNVGDLTLVQACEEEGCRVGLATGRDAPPSANDVAPDAPLHGWGERVLVARDAPAGVVYVAAARRVYEFRPVEAQWRGAEVNPAAIAARTSVPSLWLGVGLGGLLAVAALLWRRSRLTGRARSLAAAQPGVLGADGWIAMVDGTTLRLESPGLVPPGPILVHRPLPTDPYRGSDTVSPESVIAGTPEEHRRNVEAWLLSCDSAIVAVASLAGAPLVAGAMAGLVVG